MEVVTHLRLWKVGITAETALKPVRRNALTGVRRQSNLCGHNAFAPSMSCVNARSSSHERWRIFQRTLAPGT